MLVWRPATLLKRDFNTVVFLSILQKFYNYLFRKRSVNGCFLTVSMVHFFMCLKVQGLNCMMESGFSPSHSSSFLFLSLHFSSWSESRRAFKNLRRILLMSQLSFYIIIFGRFRWWFKVVLDRFLDRFRSI